MSPDSSKITIHMVSSLDGFIAGKNGSIDWMQAKDTYEKGISLTEEDIAAFLDRIDCYVMGARTYEQALELGWPYGDVPVVVVTRRNLKTDRTTVEFYSGDLDQLVQECQFLGLVVNCLSTQYARQAQLLFEVVALRKAHTPVDVAIPDVLQSALDVRTHRIVALNMLEPFMFQVHVDSVDQRVLGREVVEERPSSNAGVFGNACRGGVPEPFPGKQVDRGFQQLLFLVTHRWESTLE